MNTSLIKNNSLSITVFGGSQPKPDSAVYQDAYKFGKWLGEQGYTILNGGYIGIMEAVSKGAHEMGGKVIGITCDQIEQWRPIAPNPYITEEKRFPTLRQRLDALIDLCDLAVALPGGIGTLAEISAMWTQLDINAIPSKPLILVGREWKIVIESFTNIMKDYVNPKQLNELTFADDINDVTQRIKEIAKLIHDRNKP